MEIDPWEITDLFNTITWDYPANLPQALWAGMLIRQKKPYMVKDHWRTNTTNIEVFDNTITIIHSYDDRETCYRFFEMKGDLALLTVIRTDGSLTINMASEDKEKSKSSITQLKKIFPIRERVEDQTVTIDFWNMTSQGARSVARDLVVPTWEEIRGNYGKPLRETIDPVMRGFKAGKGGQLVLAEGPPGVGKSYFLRSLIWEWREWAHSEYIVDPDQFFGQRSDYMMQVLLNDGKNPWDFDGDDMKDKWRLLIMEDAGEFLHADAKMREGQGFSRLLNVVDGLIGQGLKILILITTNEKVNDLDPAVSRPGRCALRLDFNKLEKDDIREWYEYHELEVPEKIPNYASLAELFAKTSGLDVPTKEKFGFG